MKVIIQFDVNPEDYHFTSCAPPGFDAQKWVLISACTDVENELKPPSEALVTVINGRTRMWKEVKKKV